MAIGFNIQYPLDIRFKLLALAPRMSVTDAAGRQIMFVSQKVLALREDIQVFEDESRTNQRYRIKAEKIMDFSTRYNFTSNYENDRFIGAVKSKGWRSIWNATYEVYDENNRHTHIIKEDNPWVKVLDALLGEVPVLSMFTGYFFHPSYSAVPVNSEKAVMALHKQPSFFESHYRLEKLVSDMDPEEEQSIILSFMLMIQFMRRRG